MTTFDRYPWLPLPQYFRGILPVLVFLNLIVFGLLLARILMPYFFSPPEARLLLNGLIDERSRLESIITGSCSSAEMERYRRGEIGPIQISPGGDRLVQNQAPNPSDPSTNSLPGPNTLVTPDNRTSPNYNSTPNFALPPSSRLTPNPTAPPSSGPLPNSSMPPRIGSSPQGQVNPNQIELPPVVPSGRILNSEEIRSLVNRAVVRVLIPDGSGSGFVIAPNLIVTNRHVIEGAAENKIAITSKYLGDHPIPAKVLLKSSNLEIGGNDFAVLEMQSPNSMTPLNIGTDPKPLDQVIAAGYPGQTIMSDTNEVIPEVVFSQGEVSVLHPQTNGVSLVIHTANIARGSSGGPLINRCGTIVGVNTFIAPGENVDGRTLYSLSSTTLSKFLTRSGISHNRMNSDCKSGSE